MKEQAIELAEITFSDLFHKWNKITDMPEGYAKSTKITKTSDGINVIVDYKTEDGKPLDKFLDLGTKAHFIRPKKDDGVLSWNNAGTQMFSKGHWVSGIKGKFVLEKTMKEFKRVYTQKVQELFG